MTSDLDSGGESPIELRRQRRFRVQVRLGAFSYLVTSFALFQWGDLKGTSPWRYVWAVLPLLALAWMVTAVVLRMRQLDEYQVKLLLPGLAVGFTVSIIVAITMGTLSAAGLDVPNTGWLVSVAGVLAWEVTNVVVGAPTR